MRRKRALDGSFKLAAVNSLSLILVKEYLRAPMLIIKNQTNRGKKHLPHNQINKAKVKINLINKSRRKHKQPLMDPVQVKPQFLTRMKSTFPIRVIMYKARVCLAMSYHTSTSRTFSDHQTRETAEKYSCLIVQQRRKRKKSQKTNKIKINKSTRTKIQTKNQSRQHRNKCNPSHQLNLKSLSFSQKISNKTQ